MQHIAGKLSTSSFQRYKVCMNRSSDERVMAPGSRGIGAVFVHFSGEDSDQTGDAFGEPRVPRRSWSRYLSNAPGLVGSTCCEPERLCARRRLSGRKNAFSSQRVFLQILSQFARIFDLAPDVRISTFLVPLESLRCLLLQVFRSGFRLDPIKSWRSESSTSCMNVSSFQRMPGLADQLVASQEDSARKRGNVGRKVPEFSAKPYFVGLFSRAWPCTEASLGSQDMILANGGRRNVPYAKGFDHNFLVSRPFWARKVSNRSSHYVLQNGQGSGQFDSAFGLVNRWTLVGLGTAWSNLGQTSVNPGQTWSTLVKLGQLWSNLGKCVPDLLLRECLMRAGSGSPRLCVPTPEKIPWFVSVCVLVTSGVQMDIPRVENDRTRTPIDDQFSPIRPTVYLAFLTLGLSVALSCRCLTEAVLPLLGFVADGGIPCGPFLRDFGSVCFRCHASSIEVVVALSVGSKCTRIPYFRLSYLIGRHFLNLRSAWLNLRLFQLIPDGGSTSLTSGLSSNFSGRGKIAPVWYNEINEFLIPGLRYYHRFGRFCKRCPFAWMM
uniref:Uncharacterized protein n=1 Tax=Fagus sylvatica TaxID=28930 RepID=A0A2N9EUC7_FAGSY